MGADRGHWGRQGQRGLKELPGLLGATGATGTTGATGPLDVATLRVYVYHDSEGTGNEISGANITLSRYGLTGSEGNLECSDTWGTGYYEFTDLTYGQYLLTVNADGYETYTEVITMETSSPC